MVTLLIGSVYVFGRNDDGMIGLPTDKYPQYSSTAQKLDLPKMKAISCGSVFTFAITIEGDLYAWGFGTEGQLANGSQDDDPEDAPIPFKVELKDRRVFSVDGGGQHSVLLVEPKQ